MSWIRNSLINIIGVVVTSILLPLISFLGVKLTQWLSSKIKDDKAKSIVENAVNIVTNAVRATFQTYVEALKKAGTFDMESQIKALSLAKDIALKQLSSESVEYLSKEYGNIDNWLTTEIESAINKLKN